MEERVLPAWSERVVRLLDDGARVPGTELRFGVDALLGALLPGVGDAVSGVGSFSLLVLAWREGVPTRGLARILLNVAIDTIGGSLPVVGDVFDLFFKANRRNLELIESYRDEAAPRRAAFDYVLLSLAFLLVAAAIAIPFITVGYVWSLLSR